MKKLLALVTGLAALTLAGCSKMPTPENAPAVGPGKQAAKPATVKPSASPTPAAPTTASGPATAGAPVTAAAPTTTGAPGTTAVPASAGAPATTNAATAAVELDPKAEAAALAGLPALDTIASAPQRYTETARRALVQARACFAERSYAAAVENLDVARQAVALLAQEVPASNAPATTAVASIAYTLDQRTVADVRDCNQLLDGLAGLRL